MPKTDKDLAALVADEGDVQDAYARLEVLHDEYPDGALGEAIMLAMETAWGELWKIRFNIDRLQGLDPMARYKAGRSESEP